MTAQTLINYALIDLNAIQPGETPNADESQAALDALNQIVSSWSLEGNTVYNQKRTSYNLFPGQTNYTLGPGGSWNTAARPLKITGAISKSGNFQQGMRVMPFGQFTDQIANPTGRTDTLPSLLGYDNAAPVLNVEVWPTPNAGATIELQTWEPLTQINALTDVLSFPVPGFELALRTELVVILAPSYKGDATQTQIGNAQRAKARIIAANAGHDGSTPAAPAQQSNQ